MKFVQKRQSMSSIER